MGDPINCWTPAQFTKQWSDFVNQYCYVHGTYFVSLEDELAFDEQDRKKQPINYYQWVSDFIIPESEPIFRYPTFWQSRPFSFICPDLYGKHWSVIAVSGKKKHREYGRFRV